MLQSIYALVLLAVSAVRAAPTNDVTLFTRALFQHCEDSNNDYLAVDFLEGSEKFIAEHNATRDATRTSLSAVSQHNVVYFSSRTNYIDGKIAAWVNEETFEQVVIVAAGFDSRAYRLDLPTANFFELDFPAVVADKQTRVAANNLSCTGKSVTYVGADLRNTTAQEALLQHKNFNASLKTIFVVEGLVYYLHQPDVDKLFKSLGEVAASGSKLVFDFTNDCIIHTNCSDLNKQATQIFLTIMDIKKEPWFSGFLPGVVKSWLSAFGFVTSELLSFQNAGEAPLNVKTWTNSTIFGQMNFITAEKK